MNDHPSLDWVPKSNEVMRDQRAAYDEMRHRCPVAYSELMGWSGIAQWSGVPMRAIVDLVRPKLEARTVEFNSFGEPSASASITTRKPGLLLGLPVARSAGE